MYKRGTHSNHMNTKSHNVHTCIRSYNGNTVYIIISYINRNDFAYSNAKLFLYKLYGSDFAYRNAKSFLCKEE